MSCVVQLCQKSLFCTSPVQSRTSFETRVRSSADLWYAGALEAAKEAARAADPEDVRPRILLGNIYWTAGEASQASKEYQAALRAGPTACPLDLYLRLGTAFLVEGEFEYARNVYVQVLFIAALDCCCMRRVLIGYATVSKASWPITALILVCICMV